MSFPPSFREKRVKTAVYTTEECSNCGLKTKRPFQQGDYVYKALGECAKCKGKMGISMIYSEVVKPA